MFLIIYEILMVGLIAMIVHRFWRIMKFGVARSSLLAYTFYLEDKYPAKKQEIVTGLGITALLFLVTIRVLYGLFSGEIASAHIVDKLLPFVLSVMLFIILELARWRRGVLPFPRPFLVIGNYVLLVFIVTSIGESSIT